MYRIPLPGFYLEPNKNTLPRHRHEIECMRAAVILPIPFRRSQCHQEVRERSLAMAALGRIRVTVPNLFAG